MLTMFKNMPSVPIMLAIVKKEQKKKSSTTKNILNMLATQNASNVIKHDSYGKHFLKKTTVMLRMCYKY